MEINKVTGSQLPDGNYGKTATSRVDEITTKPVHENRLDLNYQNDADIDKEQLANIVLSFNDFMKPVRTNLKFELHDRLDRYYVSVINSETNEVIKEIPPKKMLDMYAEMADFIGILIDKKI